MDMNAGYIRAARIHLPDAVSKIAFDRFHVAKQLAEVVDKTRHHGFQLTVVARTKTPASYGSMAKNGLQNHDRRSWHDCVSRYRKPASAGL